MGARHWMPPLSEVGPAHTARFHAGPGSPQILSHPDFTCPQDDEDLLGVLQELLDLAEQGAADEAGDKHGQHLLTRGVLFVKGRVCWEWTRLDPAPA